jgi:uncharacterized membrane protein
MHRIRIYFKKLDIKKKNSKSDMVAHICNPSSQEIEVERRMESLRQPWAT